MLVGRCSSQLSSHKLQAKSKKSQPLRRFAQDDDFVGALKKKHPKEFSAYVMLVLG